MAQSANLKQVSDALRKPGETLRAFQDAWKALPEDDKTQIKQGIGDGSMTY